MKVKLTPSERSSLVDLLPFSGSISEIKTYLKFRDELKYNEDELEFLNKGLSSIKDSEDKDKALSEFNNKESELELSDELIEFLKSEIQKKDELKTISINEDVFAYDKILSL